MKTKKFRDLIQALPAERRARIRRGVEKSLAEMPLNELRQARQMTQARLAESLGINQGEVSRIEHRTDMYVSTLANYIEALGGRLEIRAVFGGREVRISQFEELPS